jgi:hypothetical protein
MGRRSTPAETAAEIDVWRLSFHFLGADDLSETVLGSRIFDGRKERLLPRGEAPDRSNPEGGENLS